MRQARAFGSLTQKRKQSILEHHSTSGSLHIDLVAPERILRYACRGDYECRSYLLGENALVLDDSD
jgi:hypothetical protein